MSGETHEDYDFPIQQLQAINICPNVFVTDCEESLMNALTKAYPQTPSLLCWWHVNKNIFSHCIKALGSDEEGKGWKDFNKAWHKMLYAPSESLFNEALQAFVSEYDKDGTKECVQYIIKQWLDDNRKIRLFSAWTDQYRHYNTTVTSRYVIIGLSLI
jgi:hypothetical protein